MTTATVIEMLSRDAAGFRPAPAPKDGPYFVRTRNATHHVLHADNWLLKEIHGHDYEWSPINPR